MACRGDSRSLGAVPPPHSGRARRRVAPRLRQLALACLGLLLLPEPARALFHLALIDEVVASHAGDPAQQFVEIRMLNNSQDLVANSVLAAFDANGAYVGDLLVVPSDVANAGKDVRWIMATDAFQSTHAFAADFTMPPGIPQGGGMLCWGAPGSLPPADPSSWDHTNPLNYVDCLAYGSYAGPGNALIGTPTPLVAEGHSLQRLDDTNDNADDFACADPSTPENNVGVRVSVAATTPCSPDADGDGTPDDVDNCLDQPNGPLLPDAGGNVQLDVDEDGAGNVCDCDFNQDQGCGQPDYSVFLACFGKLAGTGVGPPEDSSCAESDMNGDGGVGQPDYSLFISRFGGAPGP